MSLNSIELESTYSFIEPHEEQEAIKFVEEKLGFPRPRITGYFIAVKIFLADEKIITKKNSVGNDIQIAVPEGYRDEKEKVYVNKVDGTIVLPEHVVEERKFRNCSGLVLSLGPLAYKGKKFEGSGPWCKVGDWVMFPRNEGHQINYRGIPMQIIPDDRVMMVVEDPAHVTRD